jgi:hypothetical protein
MKPILPALLFCALLGACASSSSGGGGSTRVPGTVNLPTPGGPGSNPEAAVRVRANSEMTVEMEIRRWMRRNYPDWVYGPYERTEFGDRQLAVVVASNPAASGATTRRVYFDVTPPNGSRDDDGL